MPSASILSHKQVVDADNGIDHQQEYRNDKLVDGLGNFAYVCYNLFHLYLEQCVYEWCYGRICEYHQ